MNLYVLKSNSAVDSTGFKKKFSIPFKKNLKSIFGSKFVKFEICKPVKVF